LKVLFFAHHGHLQALKVCDLTSPDITGKTEFVTGKKKFRHESLVYLISLRN
jgi:hypothetical protein